MLMNFLYRIMIKLVASIDDLIKTKCFRLTKIKDISLKRNFSEFKF